MPHGSCWGKSSVSSALPLPPFFPQSCGDCETCSYRLYAPACESHGWCVQIGHFFVRWKLLKSSSNQVCVSFCFRRISATYICIYGHAVSAVLSSQLSFAPGLCREPRKGYFLLPSCLRILAFWCRTFLAVFCWGDWQSVPCCG